jgi:hypothetical protein
MTSECNSFRDKLLLGASAVWLFALPTSTTIAQNPRPGEVTIGVEEIDYPTGVDTIYTYALASSYLNSKAARYAQDYMKLSSIVAKDKAALEDKGFKANAEALDEVTKESIAERNDFVKKLGGELLGKALDGAASLNPVNVNRAVKWLQERNLGSPELIKLFRMLAGQADKRAKLEAYDKFKTAFDTGRDVAGADGAYNKMLYGLLGALKLAQNQPELAPVVSGAEIAVNLYYLGKMCGFKYVLTGADRPDSEINQLLSGTDAQLVVVSRLAGSMKANVDKQIAARRAWREATGNARANPIWPPEVH